MSDPRTDYIETLLKYDELNKVIVSAAKTTLSGGPEGIQKIAQNDPELILIAINELVTLAEANHKAHKEVFEMYLSLRDELDKFSDLVRPKS